MLPPSKYHNNATELEEEVKVVVILRDPAMSILLYTPSIINANGGVVHQSILSIAVALGRGGPGPGSLIMSTIETRHLIGYEG